MSPFSVFDEPTAVLTPQETDELMSIMRQLKDAGTAIVFITHKLREVREVADKITIMRLGKDEPLVRDIQDFLSARLGRRAIRLEIIERAQNAFVSPIRDRSLFRNATLVLEVAARRPLIEIQNDFPHLFKIGPNTKMNEMVHANLPGLPLVPVPVLPRFSTPTSVAAAGPLPFP